MQIKVNKSHHKIRYNLLNHINLFTLNKIKHFVLDVIWTMNTW